METRATRTPKARWSRWHAGAIALLCGIAAVGLSPTHAAAAELSASFSNQKITMGQDPTGTGTVARSGATITSTQALTFRTDWAIEGQVNAGDTFKVSLPTQFRVAHASTFNLVGDSGVMATCAYDLPAESIGCTFVGGPHQNPQGDLWFVGYLDVPGPHEPAPSWSVSGDVFVVEVPTPTQPGPYRPPFGNYKSGWGEIIDGKATLYWGVYMWPGSGPGTNQEVKRFKVDDALSTTGESHLLVKDSFVLERWQRAQNPDGSWVSGDDVATGVDGTWVRLARFVDGAWSVNDAAREGEVFSAPVVADDRKSFSWEIDEAQVPYQYRLSYTTEAAGAVSFASDSFSNTATVNGHGQPASATARAYGGGGANAGDYTSFTVTKSVTNNTAVNLPLTYTVTASQKGKTVETLTVAADGSPVTSAYFPVADGPITLCESLPETAGVAWSAYVFSGEGVSGPDASGCYQLAPAGGQRHGLALGNHANPASPAPSPKPSSAVPTPPSTRPGPPSTGR